MRNDNREFLIKKTIYNKTMEQMRLALLMLPNLSEEELTDGKWNIIEKNPFIDEMSKQLHAHEGDIEETLDKLRNENFIQYLSGRRNQFYISENELLTFIADNVFKWRNENKAEIEETRKRLRIQ